MGDKTSYIHGVTTKLVPTFLIFIALIYLLPKTWTGVLQVFPAENLFFFFGVLLAGLIPIYEGLNIRKDKASGAIVSATIFFIIGGFLVINSFLILFDVYDPRTDTTDYRFFFAIIFGIGFLTVILGTIWELKESERYMPHKKFPIPLH